MQLMSHYEFEPQLEAASSTTDRVALHIAVNELFGNAPFLAATCSCLATS